MGIRRASAKTTVNAGFRAAAAATTNAITIAPASATSVAGGGTLGGVTISNVAITDNTYANVLSGDTAIGSSGGFVRITGSGFQANAGVFFNNVRIANTFVSSTRINANIPATTAGTYNFYVFNNDGSGANFSPGVVTSGFPTITVTSYSIAPTSNTQITATGDAPLSFSIQPGSSNTGNFTVNTAGYIGATTVAEGAYTLTVVVDDAQNQSTQADLTINVLSTEPYFNLTTLLLPGNGNNTANNQAFIDSSTNNFAITRNGNATQGTFTPFSQTGWSNYFDGTGDTLSWPGTSLTGDFTAECWVYKTAVDASGYTNVFWGIENNQFAFDNTTAGSISLVIAGSVVIGVSGTAVVPNRWHHLAWVRQGTTYRAYVNGVQQGTGTGSAAFNLSLIGGYGPGGFEMNGYISNARITNACLYPNGTTFTPSTTPLTTTVSSGTVQLLTCQSNRFRDISTNTHAITRNGDVSVQAFSPFAPSDLYSAASIGGSGYFDGTGDYLTVPDNTALDAFTDFTIEFWIYLNSVSGTQVVIDKGWNGATVASYVIFHTNGNMVVYASSNGSSWDVLGGSSFGTLTAGQWYHIALTRSGTSIRLFRDGALVTTVTNGTTLLNNASALGIGGSPAAGANTLTGYISNLRIIKGSALYTAAFTPPTAPLTAVANTQLLLNFTNAGVTDATAKNVFETVNQTQISTAQSKFGGSSIYFDGVDDYLVAPYAPWASFGTGQFTIECWVYFDALTSNRLILDTYTSAGTGGGWQLYWRSTGTSIAYYANGVVVAQSSFTGHTTGVWYHVAVTRDTSNFLRIFVDGTQYASVSYATAIDVSTTSNVSVGIQKITSTNDFAGYIDDLRVTVGFARYTANFTVPSAPFARQ